MKPYIMMNTKLRTDAKKELENNSVFGKTMEKIRNHKGMKLVANREKYVK